VFEIVDRPQLTLTDAIMTCSVNVVDSMNAVSSSMNIVGYRHDNSALTEQRVAQILSEARAAMKAVDTPQTKVCYYHLSYCHSSYLSPFHSFFDIVSWAVPKVSPLGSWQPGVTGKV